MRGAPRHQLAGCQTRKQHVRIECQNATRPIAFEIMRDAARSVCAAMNAIAYKVHAFAYRRFFASSITRGCERIAIAAGAKEGAQQCVTKCPKCVARYAGDLPETFERGDLALSQRLLPRPLRAAAPDERMIARNTDCVGELWRHRSLGDEEPGSRVGARNWPRRSHRSRRVPVPRNRPTRNRLGRPSAETFTIPTHGCLAHRSLSRRCIV